MTRPLEFSRTVEYRGCSLEISKPGKQWHVLIIPTHSVTPQDSRVLLKGWEEDEVLRRARVRVDDILELGNRV
jgi:hypothetical protein